MFHLALEAALKFQYDAPAFNPLFELPPRRGTP